MKKNRFSKIINFRVVGLSILIAFILLTYSKTAVSDTVDITLAQGWNFISLPILPTDNDTQDVLSGLTGTKWLYFYDVSIEDPMARWKIWDDVPETPNTFTNIEPTKGYYLWREIGLPTIPPTPTDGIWVNPVPEPSTMLFLVSTLLGLTGLGWKFKK